MATITGYGSKHSHEFKLSVNEISTSVSDNTSTIAFQFSIYKSSYSWRGWNSITYSINIDGTEYTGTIPNYSAGSEMIIRAEQQVIGHNADGTKSINFSFSVNDASGQSYTCGNASASGSMALSNIPRQANFTSHYVESTTLNSIKVHWSADAQCDWLQYSLNGGNWADTSGYPTYTISGLNYNTQYSIKTRIRRKDNQLWTESGTIYGTTKDKARITSAPNIEHGNSLTVNYTNPSGSSLEIGIYKTDGITPLTGGYRSCSGSSYTFNFTDEELDNIYRLYGNNNQITLRVYLRTAGSSSYINYKDFTVTLTGNQKTIKVKVNGEYKRGKIWVKTNNEWKQAVIWAKQTEWKRGI